MPKFFIFIVDVAQMIAAAGPEQIEAWLDRVFDADDLAAIFRQRGKAH